MLALHRDVAVRVEARLRTGLAEARDLLNRHRRELDALAAALLEQETLTGEEAALVIAEARRPAARIVGDRVQAGEELVTEEAP